MCFARTFCGDVGMVRAKHTPYGPRLIAPSPLSGWRGFHIIGYVSIREAGLPFVVIRPNREFDLCT